MRQGKAVTEKGLVVEQETGIQMLAGSEIPFTTITRPSLRAQPDVHLVRTRGTFPGDKWAHCESDSLRPFSPGCCLHVFMAQCRDLQTMACHTLLSGPQT